MRIKIPSLPTLPKKKEDLKEKQKYLDLFLTTQQLSNDLLWKIIAFSGGKMPTSFISC